MLEKRSASGRFLGGRFGYFLFFLLRGGEGGVRGDREGGGVGFLLKIPGGGVSQRGWEGARGPGGCLQGIWRNWGGGGGAKYFFSGPKCPPRFVDRSRVSKPPFS